MNDNRRSPHRRHSPHRKWRIAEGSRDLEERLASALDLPWLVTRLLVNRGIKSVDKAKGYLKPSISSLHDPMLLPDMAKAVARILDARDKKERVTVYGDYDVDGVTGSAILLRFFSAIGVDAGFYLPEREAEGYGLNVAAVEKIATHTLEGTGVRKGEKSKLLITVDNGISAFDEVAVANRLGLDVIITDHHLPPENIPEAIAVIDPALAGSVYPFTGLCGAGVAFKLCMAVRSELHKRGAPKESLPNLRELLDLAAIGSIADCVPLTDENRVIVSHGLDELSKRKKPGVASLMSVAGIEPGDVMAGDVAFKIGPRINAAGRMGRADTSLLLLMTDDKKEAFSLAEKLDEANNRRRKIQADVFEEAQRMIASRGEGDTCEVSEVGDSHGEGEGDEVSEVGDSRGEGEGDEVSEVSEVSAIVLASDNWPAGVIGIVASKLVEKYRKPVALVAFKDSLGRGSARSLPGFHMTKALEQMSGHLIGFGGHEMAAGFSISTENYENFKTGFCEYAKKAMEGVDLRQVIDIDAEVLLSDFDRELVNAIMRLNPFGEKAPPPVFVGRDISFSTIRYMGATEDHVRLTAAGGVQIVGFYFGEWFKQNRNSEKDRFDLVFTPEINRFNGAEKVQLRLLDIVSLQ